MFQNEAQDVPKQIASPAPAEGKGKTKGEDKGKGKRKEEGRGGGKKGRGIRWPLNMQMRLRVGQQKAAEGSVRRGRR